MMGKRRPSARSDSRVRRATKLFLLSSQGLNLYGGVSTGTDRGLQEMEQASMRGGLFQATNQRQPSIPVPQAVT